jgi:hypothetical protein
MADTTARDAATAAAVAGVYLNPTHGGSRTVHAFRTWTGERTLETWCAIAAGLADGAHQTTDVISCVQCAEASYQDMLAWVRPIRLSADGGTG